ncbi:MAG TPA: hypothetical protein VG826_10265 [Pirellulales bacterium]|nr:hypothetical protein [Pirellulales bacterium]
MTNSRVYQNAAEGFRFLVPEGWVQTASSSLPPGPLLRDQFLTRYSIASTEPGGTFVVLCVDEKGVTDVEGHHAGPSFGVSQWRLVEGRKPVTINGAEGERILYQGAADNNKRTKVVTCFRRHGRLYSFVGMFSPADEAARQQIERATNDVIWNR